MNEIDIINILRNSFSNDIIKRQVLEENWYQENIDSGIDSTGFCFAASEVLYRLTGGTNIWQVVSKRPKGLEKWNTLFFKKKTE